MYMRTIPPSVTIKIDHLTILCQYNDIRRPLEQYFVSKRGGKTFFPPKFQPPPPLLQNPRPLRGQNSALFWPIVGGGGGEGGGGGGGRGKGRGGESESALASNRPTNRPTVSLILFVGGGGGRGG